MTISKFCVCTDMTLNRSPKNSHSLLFIVGIVEMASHSLRKFSLFYSIYLFWLKSLTTPKPLHFPLQKYVNSNTYTTGEDSPCHIFTNQPCHVGVTPFPLPVKISRGHYIITDPKKKILRHPFVLKFGSCLKKILPAVFFSPGVRDQGLIHYFSLES